MAPRRTCECGECAKCKHRERHNAWYRQPGVAEKVRLAAKESRQRRLDEVRAYDRARGFRGKPDETFARNAARAVPLEPCSVCGTTENVEKHHPDYSKPFEVVFLCRPHHRELHRKVA